MEHREAIFQKAFNNQIQRCKSMTHENLLEEIKTLEFRYVELKAELDATRSVAHNKAGEAK